MKRAHVVKRLPLLFLLVALSLSSVHRSQAQGITTYQYRYVAPAKVDEFIKRETTYWSKVAKKAIADGKMTFWALLEKIGGTDLGNSPNFMFVNSFPNIDADISKIFDPSKLFPGVPMSKMDTYSMSTETALYFLSDDSTNGFQEAANVVPDKDFKYIVMSYHNSSNPSEFNAIEKNQWGPFIKLAMDNKQTVQKGWGNTLLLAPTGGNVKFNCLSFDLYPSLTAALIETWSPDTKFPIAALDSLQKISLNEPARVVYRIVKVEAKN